MTEHSPRITTTPDVSTYTPEAERSAACLNCGSKLHGQFCSACGQRDIPPYPSTRELVVDAFWELSGWDGRFVSTTKALIRAPGMLTREFLEGRRARFLSPLRLYLLASLAYFLVAAGAPDLRIGKSVSGIRVTSASASRPERVANAAERSLDGGDVLSAEDRAKAMKDLERAPAPLRPFLKKAVGDPIGFKRGILEAMPKLLFAMLPVFAAIVAIFYRGRKYPEHLYFAIHLHAFVFVALAFAELTKFTRSVPLVSGVGVIAMLWVAVYATLAFRRVYGGSIAKTIAKEVGIGAIYSVFTLVGFILMIYWVSVLGT